jgi:hypothetical protein
MASSDLQLKRWLNSFNARFWDCSLPQITVHWEPEPGCYGKAYLHNDGSWCITIDPALAGWSALAKMTLVHECCHVATGLKHDKKFRTELLRVIQAGAWRYL